MKAEIVEKTFSIEEIIAMTLHLQSLGKIEAQADIEDIEELVMTALRSLDLEDYSVSMLTLINEYGGKENL